MRGFTLIELMVVVAILAILTAIALPAYQKQVQDSRRADAAAVMLQARQKMERYYSKHYSYKNATASDIPSKSPIGGTTEYYQLTLSDQSATAFIITAEPKNGQANDGCGDLTINQAGIKTANGTPNNVDECWR